jgi:hypothetical protein
MAWMLAVQIPPLPFWLQQTVWPDQSLSTLLRATFPVDTSIRKQVISSQSDVFPRIGIANVAGLIRQEIMAEESITADGAVDATLDILAKNILNILASKTSFGITGASPP